jgi:hypothetical protein
VQQENQQFHSAHLFSVTWAWTTSLQRNTEISADSTVQDLSEEIMCRWRGGACSLGRLLYSIHGLDKPHWWHFGRLGIVLLNWIAARVKATKEHRYHLINPATHTGQLVMNRFILPIKAICYQSISNIFRHTHTHTHTVTLTHSFLLSPKISSIKSLFFFLKNKSFTSKVPLHEILKPWSWL